MFFGTDGKNVANRILTINNGQLTIDNGGAV